MNNIKTLYTPSDAVMRESRLYSFMRAVEAEYGITFGAPGPKAYEALHAWSVEKPQDFYKAVWDFCGIVGAPEETVLTHADSILEAVFYPDAQISFAENMLQYAYKAPGAPAIISRVAGAQDDRILNWQDLYDAVSVWEQLLESYGVGEGDRVATYLPHIPEAYVLMIAVSNRGAIFSSVGTEMGVQASGSRFSQIQPKILIAVDGYTHMARAGEPGKAEDRLDVVAQLQKDVKSIERTVIIPNLTAQPDLSTLDKHSVLAPEVLKNFKSGKIEFKRRAFNTPLAILFSSGSTGQPKCFVHSSGGVLLKHAIEHQLQSDVRPGDKVFFHSTTSWMMYNWLASSLAHGATLMIYDGNPAYPGADAQLQFAADYGCTHLGTAAAIIQDVWAKAGVSGERYDLSALRSLMYTGSVLSEDGFFYAHTHIKSEMRIDGVCGGTDFVGCYAMGNPFAPTLAGHLKGPVLGMAVDVWREDGTPCKPGEVGELVVTKPFSSRPLYFWHDEDGSRFRAEYFEFFKTDHPVWRHGDAVKKSALGQLVVEGRSDTTLNQGGVRIGTQQLYDALAESALASQIEDMLAASFKDAQGGDHTALFVVLKSGRDLDEAFKKTIKGVISDSVGRLCTPHEILAVPYVLKTPNGKKAEKPTAQALAGKEIKAPETYGFDATGQHKVQIFIDLGDSIRRNPSYGFKAA